MRTITQVCDAPSRTAVAVAVNANVFPMTWEDAATRLGISRPTKNQHRKAMGFFEGQILYEEDFIELYCRVRFCSRPGKNFSYVSFNRLKAQYQRTNQSVDTESFYTHLELLGIYSINAKDLL